MRSRVQNGLLSAAFVVIVGTSGWTLNEVGKNNRAVASSFDRINQRLDLLRPGTVGHEHSEVRRFMIAGHLARTPSPVVLFGDSITEGAMLPGAICGHTVVNAGIGGAGVDELLNDAPLLLAGKSPALVVVAIGTNDAYAVPDREATFSASYAKLLQILTRVAPNLAVASIPAIEPKGALTVSAHIEATLVDRFNVLLPKLAADAGASLIDVHKAVSAEGPPATLDGVHLTPSAYNLWEGAIIKGIKKALDCDSP